MSIRSEILQLRVIHLGKWGEILEIENPYLKILIIVAKLLGNVRYGDHVCLFAL